MTADSRYAYARAAAADGDWRAAAEVLEQALERAPNWASAWFSLGEARLKLGETQRAAAAFDAALAADPADTHGAANHLALLRGGAPHSIPPAYVARLFDDYAARFDDHLVVQLGYRGPELIVAALDKVAGARGYARCLDLGCGTGLAGAALRSRVDVLRGVDLSPAMIAMARQKNIYDQLEVGELVAFLNAGEPGSADLIVAADVLMYIGELGAVLAAVSRALAPRGRFVFTLETHAGEGARLGEHLRFAHAPPGVVAQAEKAGLAVRASLEVSMRRETGVDVAGMVGVFERV